jgi:hypothetical protein
LIGELVEWKSGDGRAFGAIAVDRVRRPDDGFTGCRSWTERCRSSRDQQVIEAAPARHLAEVTRGERRVRTRAVLSGWPNATADT